jgi:3-phenylpropionate/cinnamic acid dioxygenase small subunit
MMQLSVNKADANGFEAVVNARRLDLQSFKQTVTLTFKVANHVRITEVDQGTVSQRGNLVKLRIQNQDTESMALVVVFKGTISSGVFVAPRVDSMVIS